MYRLSATLRGHDDDVRSLTSLGNDVIVSGSRDSTVRVWKKNDYNTFDSSIINFKSDGFVNTLAVHTDSVTGEKLIVSAGNDKLINLTNPAKFFDGDVNTAGELCLVGHKANICDLDINDDLILSSSWDCTSKVWSKVTGDVVYNLKGHENSVWAAKFINGLKDEFMTCGADRTIRKWKGDKQVKCIIAHDDVVRDLVVLPNGDFISCSNDATIKIWDGHTFKTKNVLVGHESFIYSLNVLPNGDVVSCGEDRSIRIWRDSKCIQIIILPCISVWKVHVLPNGDIVCGSSDSMVRIFTKDPMRYASEIDQAEFAEELAQSTFSESEINVKKENIRGIETLKSMTGDIEGMVQPVKTLSGVYEVHQWNDNKWSKIGQIVESSVSTNKQKQLYEGAYYDYVFNIDVEEGSEPLKLPVNVIDNPYDVAEKFVSKYELPHSYLQQIVDFILQNADGVKLDAPVNTGNQILPQREYLTFEKTDVSKLLGAFKKLNGKQRMENKIDENLEMLYNVEDFSGIQRVALSIIQNWENDDKLLGFDIIRAIITKLQPNEDLFPIIRSGLDDNGMTWKFEMMTIRILINTFKAKSWGEQMMIDEDIFDIIFTPYLFDNLNKDVKFMPITISTLILNYSVMVNKFQLIKIHERLVELIRKLVDVNNLMNDIESAYRLIVALGTLNYTKSIQDKEILVTKFNKITDVRFSVLRNELGM